MSIAEIVIFDASLSPAEDAPVIGSHRLLLIKMGFGP